MNSSLSERFERFHKDRQSRNRGVSKRMLQTLMDNIDFESTMNRLGIEVKSCGRDEYVGYCPDHLQHASQPPSDPKWYINSRTGLTYCMTKSHGSNLIEIARYILGLDTNEDAYEALLSGKPVEVKIHFEEHEKRVREQSNGEKLKESLAQIMPFYECPNINERCLAYFEKDEIKKSTLETFGIVSCEYGRYKDRAIVPFMNEKDELCGYVAIDLLGKEDWVRVNAQRMCMTDDSLDLNTCKEQLRKKYRKALYAPGFEGRFHLYGLHESPDFMDHMEDVMLVEGERDALKMLQEGIRCLGCHGTSIKEEQKIILNKILVNTKHLFLGFDMDEAGDKAVEKALSDLSEIIDYNKIYVLNFPNDKDGNKQDPKKFNKFQMMRLMSHAIENKIRKRIHS